MAWSLHLTESQCIVHVMISTKKLFWKWGDRLVKRWLKKKKLFWFHVFMRGASQIHYQPWEPGHGLWPVPDSSNEPAWATSLTFASQCANTDLFLKVITGHPAHFHRHGVWHDPYVMFWFDPRHPHPLPPSLSLKGKAPVPRSGYQIPEPDGCSSYFFGLPAQETVRFLHSLWTN